MHLLVLSAFRQEATVTTEYRCSPWSQCTFWCSVLSDGSPARSATCRRRQVSMHLLVLSAFRLGMCLRRPREDRPVSMHLLVLSAFRQLLDQIGQDHITSQCTFWCSVLSDSGKTTKIASMKCLNAPSGAQCFPTEECFFGELDFRVSMHLLVLSAFRPDATPRSGPQTRRLNAPSGAQCFPTPPPENRATPPFTGTKSPPTWKAPHRIGPHLSN